MRGHSVQHPVSLGMDHGLSSITSSDFVRRFLLYMVAGLMVVSSGLLFTAGWHLGTVGSILIAKSLFAGVDFLIFVAIAAYGLHKMGARIGDMGIGVAFAMGLVLVAASFPLGAVFSCFWNGIFGAYPDMSGHLNRTSAMIVSHFVGLA